MMNDLWPNRTHAGWRHVPRQLWQPFQAQPSQTVALPAGVSQPSSGDWVVIVDGHVVKKHGDVKTIKATQWSEPAWPLTETMWAWNEAECATTIQINAADVTIIEYYTGQTKGINLKLDVVLQATGTVRHVVQSAENVSDVQALVQCQVHVPQQAQVTYYYTQNHHIKRLCYMPFYCEKNSAITTHTLACTLNFARDVYYYHMQSHVQQMHSHFSLAKDTNYHEQRVYLDHDGEQINAHHQVRGIATDQAHSVHISQAIVRAGSIDCAVKQKLDFRSMAQAKIVSQPDIRVAVDAVQASHGSTVAPFDQSHLHYLRTRGLDLSVATGLMTHAFAGPLLKHWEGENCETRDQLTALLADLMEVENAS